MVPEAPATPWWKLSAARVVASTRLCAVERVVDGDTEHYVKRRRRTAPWLIAAAYALRPRFRVLSEREWLAWEPAIYRAAYGVEVVVDAEAALWLPALPGVPLSDWLAVTTMDPAGYGEALTAAAQALAAMHALRLPFPDGVERAFSHADATARNVLYDPRTRTARWFDFETAHPEGRPVAWRHADDLRALIGSVAASVDAREYPGVVARLTAETSREALRALRDIARELRAGGDLFHLAQCPLDAGRASALDAALARVLPR